MASWTNHSPLWSSWTCPGSTPGYRECWCCGPTRPHPHCLQMCGRWRSWRRTSSYRVKRPPTGASYRSCLKTCPRTTLLWYKRPLKMETLSLFTHSGEWVVADGDRAQADIIAPCLPAGPNKTRAALSLLERRNKMKTQQTPCILIFVLSEIDLLYMMWWYLSQKKKCTAE